MSQWTLGVIFLTILFVCPSVRAAPLYHEWSIDENTIGKNRETQSHFMERKRFGEMSLNQDLRTLAKMLLTHGGSSRQTFRSQLLAAGKRSGGRRVGETPLGIVDEDEVLENVIPQEENPSFPIKRFSNRLSIDGALSSLAQMLNDEGRRRVLSELRSVGKRSSVLEDTETDPHSYAAEDTQDIIYQEPYS